MRADVDGVVVVDHAHDRRLRRRLPFVGIALDEAGDLRRRLPRRVGEIAVETGTSAARAARYVASSAPAARARQRRSVSFMFGTLLVLQV